MKASTALILALAAGLSACQSSPEPRRPPSSGKSAALLTMEQVAIAAHKCWFATKDKAFRPYRMANELNSFSGTPRFLLVPTKNYGGLPLLVVQATGNSSKVDIFGPLLSEPLGARIRSDVSRWAAGGTGCGENA